MFNKLKTNFSNNTTNEISSTTMINNMLNKWLTTINWKMEYLETIMRLSGMTPPIKFSFLHDNYLEFYCEDKNMLQAILSLSLINNHIDLNIKCNNVEETYRCEKIKKQHFFNKEINILKYTCLLKRTILIPDKSITISTEFSNYFPINCTISLPDKSFLTIKLVDVTGTINFYSSSINSRTKYLSLCILLEDLKSYIKSLELPIFDLYNVYYNILNIFNINNKDLKKTTDFFIENYEINSNNMHQTLSKLRFKNNILIEAGIRNEKDETFIIFKNNPTWEFYSKEINIICSKDQSINIGFSSQTNIEGLAFVSILDYIHAQIKILREQLFI